MSNEGYSKVAQTMACHDELGIFRRFRKLGLQNLLYLQAELTHLEKDLEDLAQRDANYQRRSMHSQDWYSLAQGYDQFEYEFEGEVADGLQTNKGEELAAKQYIDGSDETDNEIKGNHEICGRGRNNEIEQEVEEEETDEDKEQWEKALQIRQKLREYYEHLNQQIYINNLPQPREHDLTFFRKWLERPKLGNNPLFSRDKDSWSGQHEDDLLALRRKPTSDPFSRWMIWSVVPYLHGKFLRHFKKPLSKEGVYEPPEPQAPSTVSKSAGHDISGIKSLGWFSRSAEKETSRVNTFESTKTLVAGCSENETGSQAFIHTVSNATTSMAYEDAEKALPRESLPSDGDDLEDFDGSQIYLYQDKRIVKTVNVLSIVFASMLPITSILVLYFVSNTLNRLVIAVVFEGLFAFALAMTTRASRGEIFAATSAFAAVQVVFMTGSNGYIGQ